MPKSSSWVCKKGCPVTKEPCPHLEALLPSINCGMFFNNPKTGKRARIIYTDLIEVFEDGVQYMAEGGMTREDFDSWLGTMPLSRLERILLVSYFYDGNSYRQVALDNKIPGGAAAVNTYITTALNRLKQEKKSE